MTFKCFSRFEKPSNEKSKELKITEAKSLWNLCMRCMCVYGWQVSKKKQGHSNFMWCLVVSAVSSAWTAWTECTGAGWKGRRPSRSQPANGSSPQWNWQVNHTTLLQQIMPWQMPRPMLIASTTSLLLACALSRHLLGCINSVWRCLCTFVGSISRCKEWKEVPCTWQVFWQLHPKE